MHTYTLTPAVEESREKCRPGCGLPQLHNKCSCLPKCHSFHLSLPLPLPPVPQGPVLKGNRIVLMRNKPSPSLIFWGSPVWSALGHPKQGHYPVSLCDTHTHSYSWAVSTPPHTHTHHTHKHTPTHTHTHTPVPTPNRASQHPISI